MTVSASWFKINVMKGCFERINHIRRFLLRCLRWSPIAEHSDQGLERPSRAHEVIKRLKSVGDVPHIKISLPISLVHGVIPKTSCQPQVMAIVHH